MPEKPPPTRQTYASPRLETHLEYRHITFGPGLSFGTAQPPVIDRLIAWEKVTD